MADEEPKQLTSVVEINVPDNLLGVVAGPSDCTINLIKEKTDVKSINIEANIVRIEGKPDAVALAQQAVEEVMQKGFTSLMCCGFKSDEVEVPSISLPDLMGKEGCIVNVIMEALLVQIDMPEVTVPAGSCPKKTTVTVAGKAENVEMAKNILNDIVMYYHHEVTHPGWVHEDIEVEQWKYKCITGEAGSELQHIEQNYKVRVRIPSDETLNKNVVVVGEKGDVDQAVAYIHNLLAKAIEPGGQGASDKADD